MVLQVALGGGSVWFNGRLFGGNPRAKMLWKYHRCVVHGESVFIRGALRLGPVFAYFVQAFWVSPLAAVPVRCTLGWSMVKLVDGTQLVRAALVGVHDCSDCVIGGGVCPSEVSSLRSSVLHLGCLATQSAPKNFAGHPRCSSSSCGECTTSNARRCGATGFSIPCYAR